MSNLGKDRDKIVKSESSKTNRTNTFSPANTVNTTDTTPKRSPLRNKRVPIQPAPTSGTFLHNMSSKSQDSAHAQEGSSEAKYRVLATQNPYLSHNNTNSAEKIEFLKPGHEDSVGDASLSDLSQLEEVVLLHDSTVRYDDIPPDEELVSSLESLLPSPQRKKKRPVSFFDEESSKKENRDTIEKIIDIYDRPSTSKTQKSRQLPQLKPSQDSKENVFDFYPSSSSSLIGSKTKLDTKRHTDSAKEPMQDITKEIQQHSNSDESQNTSGSYTSNLYKNNSTLSTQELLSALLNDSSRKTVKPQRSLSRLSSSGVYEDTMNTTTDSLLNLTHILENDSEIQNQGFKIPTHRFNTTKSPPKSVTSHEVTPLSSRQIQVLDIQIPSGQHSPSLASYMTAPPKLKRNFSDSSNSSQDSFHSFENVDYGNHSVRLPFSNEKAPFDDDPYYTITEPIFGNRVLPTQQTMCTRTTLHWLLILSAVIPPFYLLLATGALEVKIGRLTNTQRLIAGILSLVGTVLILMAIGLAFGYGITHK